jgi:hypothetical protein
MPKHALMYSLSGRNTKSGRIGNAGLDRVGCSIRKGGGDRQDSQEKKQIILFSFGSLRCAVSWNRVTLINFSRPRLIQGRAQ